MESVYQTAVNNPASFAALFIVLFLILVRLYFHRMRLTPHMLVLIALMLALTTLLHQVRLFHLPQGGSLTLGAMIPLLMLAWRYGPSVGFLGGFLYSILNLMQDPFILHPVQVLFDYPLPMMAMGLAGFFPQRRFVGTAVAFFARYCCHVISGVFFFGSYAPAGQSPLLYSLSLNAAFLLPEFFIAVLILRALPIERLLLAMDPHGQQREGLIK